jgi:hypothetical protein
VVAKTGDTISGVTLTGATAAGINDEGTVLLMGYFAGGYGLFTKDSVVALTTDTIEGFPVQGIGSSGINDCGKVVFTTNQAVVLAFGGHKRANHPFSAAIAAKRMNDRKKTYLRG